MAGKRIYITMPSRDVELLRYLGVHTRECIGHVARRFILEMLYSQLKWDTALQDYDEKLGHKEREEVLRGRRG